MHEHLIIGMASVVALGVLAQWFAWRFKLPSILVLLLVGFVVGPVTGLLEPDRLLGDLTLPFVGLAAAIILFEGGLSASWDEIRQVAGPVRRLVTVGLGITWGGIAAAATVFLDVPWEIGVLIGAVLVVTGPTVIGPLLRHVRPEGKVGSIAKLEGIVNDPVGAVCAILVFEAIRAEGTGSAVTAVATGVVTSLVVGGLFGLGGAGLVVLLLRKRMLPGFLQNSVTMALVLGVYAAAGAVQPESGLLAVTLMGVALASQRVVAMRAIIEFNEHMRVVLISILFVVLAARIELSAFTNLPLGVLAFVAAVFLLRIVAVGVSMLRSDTSWSERLWLAGMAPRGIVAAAVASLFGLRLAERGMPGAELLMPVVFLVIVATVGVYGLAALPFARMLGLRSDEAQGVLILGADAVARTIARGLEAAEVRSLLVDPDWGRVAAARQEGLDAEHGLIASERLLDRLDLQGLGHLLAASQDDQANLLAAVHFRDVFDDHVYQLHPEDGSHRRPKKWAPPAHLRGRTLGEGLSHRELANIVADGGRCKATKLTERFDWDAFRGHYGRDAHPLFVIHGEDGTLAPFEVDGERPGPGTTVVSLVERSALRDEAVAA
ncbi:MAG TPA: sodium:proton antiporter [Sandaracinaceae bacterium LLY-WYZ-13_1]|nr:sodium:proton antiporter [Sandaracinaceae bacterium LLY-WYZ-13_1]